MTPTTPLRDGGILRFSTVASLIATTRRVREGSQLRADRFLYKVAAPDATDHHITTAAGDRIYAIDSEYNPLAFGAVGDGTTDDTSIVQACVNAARVDKRPVRFSAMHAIDTLSVRDVYMFGQGNGSGLRQRPVTTFFANGVRTGPWGVVLHSLSTWLRWENLELDGNSAAHGDRAIAYSNTWANGQHDRWKVNCNALNCGETLSPLTQNCDVTLSNLYIHDWPRSGVICQSDFLSVEANNLLLENVDVDHHIYAGKMRHGAWSNITLRGYAHSGMIVAINSAFSNVVVDDLVAHPLRDETNNYDFDTTFVFDCRSHDVATNREAPTISGLNIRGDLNALSPEGVVTNTSQSPDSRRRPSAIYSSGNGFVASNVSICHSGDDTTLNFIAFSFETGAPRRGTQITGVRCERMPNPSILAFSSSIQPIERLSIANVSWAYIGGDGSLVYNNRGFLDLDIATDIAVSNIHVRSLTNTNNGPGRFLRCSTSITRGVIDNVNYYTNPFGNRQAFMDVGAGNSNRLSNIWTNCDAPTATSIGTISAMLGCRFENRSEDLTLPSGAYIRLGSYVIWVDANGDLRIFNGEPSSDIDGVVVGAQS